jgi:hypothetical protein
MKVGFENTYSTHVATLLLIEIRLLTPLGTSDATDAIRVSLNIDCMEVGNSLARLLRGVAIHQGLTRLGKCGGG